MVYLYTLFFTENSQLRHGIFVGNPRMEELTMIYQSTRGASAPVNSAQAVLKGLADDGGLYMMKELPEFDWQACLQKDTKGMAKQILSALLPEIQPIFLSQFPVADLCGDVLCFYFLPVSHNATPSLHHLSTDSVWWFRSDLNRYSCGYEPPALAN